MPLMVLTDVRALAAAVLEPVDDDDPNVIETIADLVDPPAYMPWWADPWIEPGFQQRQSMGPCFWTAHLQIICVATRIDPGAGTSILDEMVASALAKFRDDTLHQWPPGTTSGPRQILFGGVPYLGARIDYDVQITV